MNPSQTRSSLGFRYAQAGALFLLYVSAGKLGLMLATDNPSVTPVWAPTGIAIAGLLLQGLGLWPAVFLGAFVVNVTTAGGIATSLGIATGNTLEGIVGAALVRRFAGGTGAFREPQTLFVFALLAGVVASSIGATVGVSTLALGHLLAAANAFPAWLTWWLGDGSGALLVAPLLVLWAEPRPVDGAPGRLVEIGALCLVIVAVSGLVFTGILPAGLGFIGTSLLVWAAFRFGQRVTATATVLLAAIAVWGTMRGHGPFVHGDINDSLLLLQTYMAVIAITALAMSAAVRQQRAANTEVTRLADRLELQVDSRTRRLADANRRLRVAMRERRRAERGREALVAEQAARREAERANRQKDDFLATLSHELRTPLNAIVGWAELLQHGALDAATGAQAVRAIARNARIQTRLISDILDVSRITSGKFEVSLRPLDPEALVESVVELVRPQAAAKHIRLNTAIEGAGVIAGDLERLQQAVGNVMSNAVKFTPEGGRIDVMLRPVPAAVELSVADSGPGIEPEFLPHVFDRFEQRDASSTRRHGGLGLGLSIARHILDQHRGSITAANRDAGGAVFTIRIPSLMAPPALGETHEAPSRRGEVLGSQALAGVRILVVDDQDSARDLAAAVLTGCGAHVSTAGSAAEALQLLRDRPFDALVTDLSMPGEDGYGLLARARADGPRAAAIPAIALTAVAGPEEEQRARAAGFQRFIVKPASPATLVRAVAQVTAAAAPAADAPPPRHESD